MLFLYPFCRDPDSRHPNELRKAEHADHIIPLAQGGPRDDPINGQGLCKACHDTKTGREGQARR